MRSCSHLRHLLKASNKILITNQENPIDFNETKNIINEVKYNESYLSFFNFSQKTLNLDHEFIQYKIKFYENSTINYNYFLRFFIKEIHPHYYMIIFTNGSKGIMKREINGKFYDAPILGYGMIPGNIFIDINLGKFHVGFGKLLFKILPIGNTDGIKGNIEVKSGAEWYLTLGVYHKSRDETFFISIESEKPCFEVIKFDRSNKIEYLSAAYNDFSGFYTGIKIFSFGISYARNIAKTITTTKGSIIEFSSSGHLKGNINVYAPDGNQFTNNNAKLASFHYFGNQTGTWKFSSSGFGFPRKHMVSLFYIDADPHIQLDDW